MSLDYDYELATSESPRRVAELVRATALGADLIDVTVPADQLLQGWTTSHGTWFRVLDDHRTFPYNVLERSFGFAPTVRVTFSPGGYEHRDPDQQLDDIIRVVSALLRDLPGDAALMFSESDEAYLLRRGGDLAVSEIDYRWPPHRLALLPHPYRRASYSLT